MISLKALIESVLVELTAHCLSVFPGIEIHQVADNVWQVQNTHMALSNECSGLTMYFVFFLLVLLIAPRTLHFAFVIPTAFVANLVRIYTSIVFFSLWNPASLSGGFHLLLNLSSDVAFAAFFIFILLKTRSIYESKNQE